MDSNAGALRWDSKKLRAPGKARKTAPNYATREEYLQAAADEMRRWLLKEGAGEFPRPLISIGFSSMGKRSNVIGECWRPETTEDKRSTIFVVPHLTDVVRTLDVLLHELIHAATPGAGHKGEFKRLALAIGFHAPLTATRADGELLERLNGLAERLGTFPHSRLIEPTIRIPKGEAPPAGPFEGKPEGAPKKQKCRQRKYECPKCGQIIRAATDELNAVCGDCDVAFEGPK